MHMLWLVLLIFDVTLLLEVTGMLWTCLCAVLTRLSRCRTIIIQLVVLALLAALLLPRALLGRFTSICQLVSQFSLARDLSSVSQT